MKLHYDNHLHTDKQDPIADWLIRSMKTAQMGKISLNVKSQQAVKIEITNNGNKIMVDLLEQELFSAAHDETSLWDKLKSAKEFANKLADNGMTISFLRKGKKAITLGKDAKPRLSKVITRSDNLEIDSVIQTTNLKRDLKVD